MTPASMLVQAGELFRKEGSPAHFEFAPNKILKVTDKHNEPWYCWNVVGEVPNVVKAQVGKVRLGLAPDSAEDISGVHFRSAP
jgi:hypothetical protein